MTSRQKILLIVFALAVSLALGLYSYTSKTKSAKLGTLLQHSTYLHDQNVAIPEFYFTDHHQKEFSTENIKNKWTFWFFGFTHCPDICPITLGTLTAAMNKLQSENSADDSFIVFVSVDPERDHPEQLKTYVSAFSDKIVGVTTDRDHLDVFLKNMGIVAVKQPSEDSPSEYLVDHSSSIFLIAPDTGISAIFGTPHSASGIAEDFIKIRKYYRN